MNPRDVLLRAANHIEEHGLWKEDRAPEAAEVDDFPAAPMCIEGAIAFVESGNPFNATLTEARDLVRAALSEVPDPFAVSTWNDDPNTTQEQVVALLRDVAEKVDQ